MGWIWTLFISLLFMGACGVKGRPLAPVEPAQIGYGYPELSAPAENSKKKKTERKAWKKDAPQNSL